MDHGPLEFALLVLHGAVFVAVSFSVIALARQQLGRSRVIALVSAGLAPAAFLFLQSVLNVLAPAQMAQMSGFGGKQWFMTAVVLAGVPCAAWWWRHVRWLSVWIAFVPVVSTVAWVLFENATPGPSYIRSEGLAITLSLAVWYVSYALLLGVPLLLWVCWARPRNSGACATCGYDLRGLTTGPCPECGILPHKTAIPPTQTRNKVQ